MDIRQIAEEKYPDLDLRPFADKDGFIRNESSYWKMQEKRTAQRVAWIDGVNWCVSQKLSTSESALPISDDVGRSEQLKALEDLKDFAYDNCQPHNSDRLSEIMERL